MPRFCRYCGEELKRPQAKHCPACGCQLRPVGQPDQALQDRSRMVIRVPWRSPQEVRLDQPALTVGRNPDNDIVLSAQFVSGRHGRLVRRGTEWHYRDLGSTNGAFVNGKPVQSAVLRDGDVLRIGDPQGNSVSMTLKGYGGTGEQGPAPGTIHIGTTVLARKTSLIIGRDPQADIQLPAPVVSWHHARLDQTPQGHTLIDLNSTNGTFINGHRLTEPHRLQRDDVVQIGRFKLVYEGTDLQRYASTGGMRLDGMKLTRVVGQGPNRKRILKSIDLAIYPREFVALVGASGAGKSTLLKALSGFERAEGDVLVNGNDLYQHFDLYRTMVGYVPQDDIIHAKLTAADALRYAARLRLPSDTSTREIEQRIDEVLQQVGMMGQKKQVISKLSGGQRKRVSIAVELLAEPLLFFLDEPTSGLDPGLEKKMMHTLRRLADGGQTVVLVTHATANITQCDHVCFLSQGRMVYFGPPEEAHSFFGLTDGDFADIYSRIDHPDPKEKKRQAVQWEKRFRASPQHDRYVADRQRQLPRPEREAARAGSRRRPRVNPVRQFFVLTRRYLDLVLRDRLLLTVLLAIMPVIGMLILLISEPNWLVGDSKSQIAAQLTEELGSGDQPSATYAIVGSSQRLLFIMALAAVLLGMFAAAYEIVKERAIYWRERMVTLRLFPYLMSKVVVLGAFSVIQCLLLLLAVGLKVELPSKGVFLAAPIEMYVTLVLGTLAAVLLGLFVSAFVPNTDTVIYMVLLVLFFQIIFAGVLFDLPDMAGNLSNLTLSRWVMEGLGTSVNMPELNEKTRTRFHPDPMTKEMSVDVERPDPDWEPVTVTTETQSIEGCAAPIPLPKVTENEMVTVTETVTKTKTFTPPAQEISTEQDFQINYAHTPAHLCWTWLVLVGFGLVFGTGTVVVLKRQDAG